MQAILRAYTGIEREQHGDELFAGKQANATMKTKGAVAGIGVKKRTVEKIPDEQAISKVRAKFRIFPGVHVQLQGQFGLRKRSCYRLKPLGDGVGGSALAASRQAQANEADEAGKTDQLALRYHFGKVIVKLIEHLCYMAARAAWQAPVELISFPPPKYTAGFP